MRKILWLPLLSAVCAFTSLRADLTIVLHVEGAGQIMDDTVLVKDGHVRFVYPQEQRGPTSGASMDAAGTIFDLKSGDMISLFSAVKNYIRIPMAQAARDAMMQSPGLLKDGGASLAPAGKKDTISGYAADEYTGAIAGRKMTVWLTKAMPDYENIAKQMRAAFAQGPIAATFKSMGTDMEPQPGGIPVRTIYETGSGQTVNSTVVSISVRPIAHSEFEIPADYKEISIDPPPPPQ